MLDFKLSPIDDKNNNQRIVYYPKNKKILSKRKLYNSSISVNFKELKIIRKFKKSSKT